MSKQPEYVIWQRGYWIPASHQLYPAPSEICQKLEEKEPGWEKFEPRLAAKMPAIETEPASGETLVLKSEREAKKAKRHWILDYFKGNDEIGWTPTVPWLDKITPIKLQPGPVARVDKNPAITIKRVTAEILKSKPESDRDYQLCVEQVGKKVGKYACVATDGHRALLVRDAPAKKGKKARWTVTEMPKATDHNFVVSDPEIINGLRRLETITRDGRLKVSWVKFSLSAEEGRLVLSSSVEEISGREVYQCEATKDIEFCLDPHYVIPLMGTYPMVVYFEDDKSPLIMMPKTRSRDFMYVVMPVRP